ncbi:MAG TPA: hypothetical protein HPP58_02180 [Deltaproteobacteria bacterium]|nr:hypothetical protein [Deltaproteobacteria bacterium]
MICPKCGAVYNVDDSEIPDKGVRKEGRDWFLEEFQVLLSSVFPGLPWAMLLRES